MLNLVTASPHKDRDDLYVTCWPSTQKILQVEITQVQWSKPKDQYMELSKYKRQEGDPATNGLGHTTHRAPDGTELVKVANTGI